MMDHAVSATTYSGGIWEPSLKTITTEKTENKNKQKQQKQQKQQKRQNINK